MKNDAKKNYKELRKFLSENDLASHLEAVADKILVSDDLIFQGRKFKESLFFLVELKRKIKAA